MNVVTLDSDNGFLREKIEVILPQQNPNSAESPLIGDANNVALSKSGAIGFVSTFSKWIFAFDTETGEVVNEYALPDNLTYIHSTGQPGVLLYATATDRLGLLDVVTGPVVTEVKVKNNRMIIRGVNFLAGTRVQVNGTDLGLAERSPENPGREMIINRDRKDFPVGPLSVVVISRDGLSSTPFTVN